ncbi:MAG: AraC family transcriptional regulator ligand-binding domain-containing protein [Polyangiales bacterium]
MKTSSYKFEPASEVLLQALGANKANVLRRAGLPLDSFSHPQRAVAPADYNQFWDALAEEVDDPALPIRIVEFISAEYFNPTFFAALCSPNLHTALCRLSLFKALVGPLSLDVEADTKCVRARFVWPDREAHISPTFVALELLFLVRLARIGTRTRLAPVRVRSRRRLEPAAEFEAFFGVCPETGAWDEVEFSLEDARRPFLTANAAMWDVFEPALRRDLSELKPHASSAERVRTALNRGLPSGRTSIDDVAQDLGTSKRTLQRWLREEGTSFREVLRETRVTLATHYLRATNIPVAEVSLLLGFEEPNSFYRAFQSWTGGTPEAARRAAN